MYQARSSKFIIHPSIEHLCSRIDAITVTTDPQSIAQLRDVCRAKIRSYPQNAYLRNQTQLASGPEPYDKVLAFANGCARADRTRRLPGGQLVRNH